MRTCFKKASLVLSILSWRFFHRAAEDRTRRAWSWPRCSARQLECAERRNRIQSTAGAGTKFILKVPLTIRTRMDRGGVAGAVRQTEGAVLKNVPIVRMMEMNEQIDSSIVPQR